MKILGRTVNKFLVIGIVIFGCLICSIIAIIYNQTPAGKASSTQHALAEAITQTWQARPTNIPLPSSTPLPTALPSATLPPSETPLPRATLEPLAELQQIVTNILGTSNRNVQRLANFSYDPGNSEITVTFAANDNLTESMIKFGIQMDIEDILKTIQQSNTSIPYTSIFVMATFPLTDVYGNSKESNVVLATYNRTNLDKVNWDNFITDNVYLIANQDTLFIHPAVQP